MKIKELIFEAPLPVQQPGTLQPPTKPAGTPGATPATATATTTAPGATPPANQPVPPNQQVGQAPAGQPAKPGQPVAPGQQPVDPQQQFAQQLAQQTTQIGSTIKKELPAIAKLAPGVNIGDPNKLAKDLALAQTNAPNKPLPPSLKPTFDKLGPVIGKMLAGDPSKLDAALKSAVPPK